MQHTSTPTTPEDAAAQVEAMRTVFGPFLDPAPSGHDLLHPEKATADRRIAIIDDQPVNIKIVQKYLKLAGYTQFVTATDARQGLDLIRREQPDLVLLDIMMPYVSGLDILAELRRCEEYADLPVIILTAASEQQTKLEALRLGTTEFLQKPVDPVELEARVRNVLVMKAHQDRIKSHARMLEEELARRSAQLVVAHREVVLCLAAVGEYRDFETGRHVLRVGKYAEIIAQHLGMTKEFVERIRDAAPLHDIGKVGIPDAILLKPGALESAEFEQVKRHTEYGKAICTQRRYGTDGGSLSHTAIGQAVMRLGTSPILQMAASIAHTHHERWDGGGYPRGLAGEAIPMEGRITAVADVFDALTTHRPYKPAFPLEKSLEIIHQQRGTQFDPRVVDAFGAGLDRIIAVYHEFADTPDSRATPISVGLADGMQDPADAGACSSQPLARAR
jgi:putative two-component system response regulator